MNRRPLLASFLVSLLLCGCTKTPHTVMDACIQYKAARDREAELRRRIATTINCEELTKKFESQCTQADLDYAYEAFKEDAEKLRALKTPEELEGFKSSFKRSRLSKNCNTMAE